METAFLRRRVRAVQTTSFEVYVLGLLAVLERLPIPTAIAFDAQAKRVQGNRAFRELYGLGPADNASFTNVDIAQSYHFEDADGNVISGEALPMRRAAFEGIEQLDVSLWFVPKRGERRALVVSAWPLTDPDGQTEGSIGVLLDVTESQEAKRRAELAVQALRESERRYRLITEAMPEFVWLDAPDGSAIYSNKRWLEYTGLSEEENEGLGWERVVHPDDKARLQSDRDRTLRSGDPYEGECRYRGKDGKYRWFLFRSIAVRDESGAITSWLGTATDIDRQKRAEAQQAFLPKPATCSRRRSTSARRSSESRVLPSMRSEPGAKSICPTRTANCAWPWSRIKIRRKSARSKRSSIRRST